MIRLILNVLWLASGAANVVWLIVAGWWLALSHVLAGVALCITIIGIPFGVQAFKMAGLALTPLGRQIVRSGAGAPLVA